MKQNVLHVHNDLLIAALWMTIRMTDEGTIGLSTHALSQTMATGDAAIFQVLHDDGTMMLSAIDGPQGAAEFDTGVVDFEGEGIEGEPEQYEFEILAGFAPA